MDLGLGFCPFSTLQPHTPNAAALVASLKPNGFEIGCTRVQIPQPRVAERLVQLTQQTGGQAGLSKDQNVLAFPLSASWDGGCVLE